MDIYNKFSNKNTSKANHQNYSSGLLSHNIKTIEWMKPLTNWNHLMWKMTISSYGHVGCINFTRRWTTKMTTWWVTCNLICKTQISRPGPSDSMRHSWCYSATTQTSSGPLRWPKSWMTTTQAWSQRHCWAFVICFLPRTTASSCTKKLPSTSSQHSRLTTDLCWIIWDFWITTSLPTTAKKHLTSATRWSRPTKSSCPPTLSVRRSTCSKTISTKQRKRLSLCSKKTNKMCLPSISFSSKWSSTPHRTTK